MGLDYRPLWKLLIDRDLTKQDLKTFGLTAPTIAKMGRDEPVSLKTIDKICTALDCEIGDVVVHRKECSESQHSDD